MFNLNEGLLKFITENVITAEWQYYAYYIGFVLFAVVAAYLLGSLNSAIIVSKLLYGEDIRTFGSGNAGLTNMLRTYGKKGAALTLAGDMLTTALAIFIAGTLLGFNYMAGMSYNDGYCYMAALFAVLGHVFPIYYQFRGGKGVLVTATAALILTPLAFGILLLVFIAIVYVSRYVSLGSVSVALLYPVVVTAIIKLNFTAIPGILSLSIIIIAVLVVWCHRQNLQRISDRTERKISIGSRKGGEKDKDVDEGAEEDE